MNRQLEQYRKNLAAGLFESIVEKSRQVIEISETKSPADIAFYSLGEVYAHHDYEGKDYAMSKYYFDKLNENFPDSSLTSEAKIYLSLFETITDNEMEAAVNQKSITVAIPHNVIRDHDFVESTQRNEQVLKIIGNNKPADEALFNLGLIYAHVDNPAKDYKISQSYFHVLTEQFPDSDFAEEARIWLGLFETIEKIQQIDIDIEQQKKQLTR